LRLLASISCCAFQASSFAAFAASLSLNMSNRPQRTGACSREAASRGRSGEPLPRACEPASATSPALSGAAASVSRSARIDEFRGAAGRGTFQAVGKRGLQVGQGLAKGM
jgi:hypothetical protein